MRKFIPLFLFCLTMILDLNAQYIEKETAVLSSDGADVGQPTYMRDDEKAYLMFEIDVEDPGSYYTSFWILPIRINDSQFAVYEVFLDGEKIGSITPERHGWQAISMDRKATVELSAGKHYIHVGVPYYIPLNVERIYFAKKLIDASEVCADYESFFSTCNASDYYDFMAEVQADDYRKLLMGDIPGCPLLYTFSTFVELKKKTVFNIRSMSKIPHCVDVVFWGKSRVSGINPPIRPLVEPGEIGTGGLLFDYATSEQKAGLTWTAGCAESKQSLLNPFVTDFKIVVPEDGKYLLRVRSLYPGGRGSADIEFSSKELSGEWKEVPITNSFTNVFFPPNYSNVAYTEVANQEVDEPIMFFQLYNGDRIMDYSYSHTKTDEMYFPEIGKNDAVIFDKSWDYPVGVISVNSFISGKPESEYTLHYYSGNGAGTIQEYIRAKKVAEEKKVSLEDSQMAAWIDGENLTIRYEEAGRIEIYDIKGNLLGIREVDGLSNEVIIPLSEINVRERGVYIIRHLSSSSIHTVKILI